MTSHAHLAAVAALTQPTRHRVGATRPGLPDDADNPWTRSVLTWRDALVNQGKTPATADGYARNVGWLAGDLAGTVLDPWQLTPQELQAWLDQQHWSTMTHRRVLVSLRAFYEWAARAGLTTTSPLSGIASRPRLAPGPTRMQIPDLWTDALDDYATWLRASARTEATIRTRRDRLATFARSHPEPWTVTESMLTRWLSQPDWSPAYKRSTRDALRSFYKWALRTGHTSTDPAHELDPIRLRRTLPRPVPTDVVHLALAAADDRIRLAFALAIYAGLRRAEIAGLHTRDLSDDAIRVVGKGGNERLVPLHPELAGMLTAELQRRRDGHSTEPVAGHGWPCAGRGGTSWVPPADGWLFPSSTNPDAHITPRWLGKMMSAASQPGWTAHTFRHRFATQAYQGTKDLRAVQELLGHSKPETTARYAAVPDAQRTAAVRAVSITD